MIDTASLLCVHFTHFVQTKKQQHGEHSTEHCQVLFNGVLSAHSRCVLTIPVSLRSTPCSYVTNREACPCDLLSTVPRHQNLFQTVCTKQNAKHSYELFSQWKGKERKGKERKGKEKFVDCR